MKILPFALTGAVTIGATLPAIVGPDWQMIEQTHKAKAGKMQRGMAQQPQFAAVENDTPKKIVPPLDHGPRAKSPTPPNNAIQFFE